MILPIFLEFKYFFKKNWMGKIYVRNCSRLKTTSSCIQPDNSDQHPRIYQQVIHESDVKELACKCHGNSAGVKWRKKINIIIKRKGELGGVFQEARNEIEVKEHGKNKHQINIFEDVFFLSLEVLKVLDNIDKTKLKNMKTGSESRAEVFWSMSENVIKWRYKRDANSVNPASHLHSTSLNDYPWQNVVAGHNNQPPKQSNSLMLHSAATEGLWHPTSSSLYPTGWTVGYIQLCTENTLLDIMQGTADGCPKLWHCAGNSMMAFFGSLSSSGNCSPPPSSKSSIQIGKTVFNLIPLPSNIPARKHNLLLIMVGFIKPRKSSFKKTVARWEANEDTILAKRNYTSMSPDHKHYTHLLDVTNCFSAKAMQVSRRVDLAQGEFFWLLLQPWNDSPSVSASLTKARGSEGKEVRQSPNQWWWLPLLIINLPIHYLITLCSFNLESVNCIQGLLQMIDTLHLSLINQKNKSHHRFVSPKNSKLIFNLSKLTTYFPHPLASDQSQPQIDFQKLMLLTDQHFYVELHHISEQYHVQELTNQICSKLSRPRYSFFPGKLFCNLHYPIQGRDHSLKGDFIQTFHHFGWSDKPIRVWLSKHLSPSSSLLSIVFPHKNIIIHHYLVQGSYFVMYHFNQFKTECHPNLLFIMRQHLLWVSHTTWPPTFSFCPIKTNIHFFSISIPYLQAQKRAPSPAQSPFAYQAPIIPNLMAMKLKMMTKSLIECKYILPSNKQSVSSNNPNGDEANNHQNSQASATQKQHLRKILFVTLLSSQHGKYRIPSHTTPSNSKSTKSRPFRFSFLKFSTKQSTNIPKHTSHDSSKDQPPQPIYSDLERSPESSTTITSKPTTFSYH
ncbi:hypothetical protein VP01_3205g1 [Puccinia sorghi]|uniref:Uncharacterized protein n=1 Tax=Puccinia sorghi TaxID=27349 RepID=A0A0L6UYE4_9BASI|nr:hypothetical protein VP01_3205g1 [Puccinia sorghi]